MEISIKKALENDGSIGFSNVFQDMGNCIRATGQAFVDESDRPMNVESILDLPRRINQFIKVLRNFGNIESKQDPKQATTKYPLRVVINNFKNKFEAFYFKKRYSSFFYLLYPVMKIFVKQNLLILRYFAWQI